MPDTSGTSGFSNLPSISDIGLIAGTFVGGLIAALGIRRGGADRDKPAPTADTAGPMGLIVEESLLREMLGVLRTIAENQVKFRSEDNDRRAADALDDLEVKNRELNDRIIALQSGQKQTHGHQDEVLANQSEILDGLTDLRRSLAAIRKDAGPYETKPR